MKDLPKNWWAKINFVHSRKIGKAAPYHYLPIRFLCSVAAPDMGLGLTPPAAESLSPTP